MPSNGARSPGAGADRDAASSGEVDPRVDPLAALGACATAWQEADSWERCLAGLALVEDSAAHVGQLALYDMCAVMRRHLVELAGTAGAPDDGLLDFINLWPCLVASWLETGQEAHVGDQLMAFLGDPRWASPLSESEAATLRGLLYIDGDEAAHAGAHADVADSDDDVDLINGDLYVDVSHDLVVGNKSLPSAPRNAARVAATRADETPTQTPEPVAPQAPDVPAAADSGAERVMEQVETLLEEMAGSSSLADGLQPEAPQAAHDDDPGDEDLADTVQIDVSGDDGVGGIVMAQASGADTWPDDFDHAEALLAGLDDLDALEPAGEEDLRADEAQADEEEDFLEVLDGVGEDAGGELATGMPAPDGARMLADMPRESIGEFDDALEDASFVACDDASGGDPEADPAGDRGVRIDAQAFLAPDDIPEHPDGGARVTDDVDDALIGAGDDDGDEGALIGAHDFADDDDGALVDAHDLADEAQEGASIDLLDPVAAEWLDATSGPASEHVDDAAEAADADDWTLPTVPDWVPDDEASRTAEAQPANAGGAGAGELPPAALEMIELLVLEAAQTREVLGETLAIAGGSDAAPEERRAALAHFAEQLERFTGAVELLGLEGLGECCNHLYENVLMLAGSDAAVGDGTAQSLDEACALLRAYLEDLPGSAPAESLAAVMARDAWPMPVDGERLGALGERLANPQVSVDDDTPARETTASPEDVSLRLPDDVDAEVLDGLLQDLPGQTAEFSASMSRVIAGGTLEDLEVAQRIAHTVKGAANTVGVAGIANLTHHVEDILLALTKHDTFPGRSLGETLVSAADCLESMGEALLGQGPAPTDRLEILQLVLDWANRIDAEGIAAVSADSAPAPRAAETAEVEAADEAHAPQELDASSEWSDESAARAPAAVSGPRPDAEEDHERVRDQSQAQVGTTPMVRIPAPLVDELLRLAGENIILTGQIQERLALTAREAQSMRSQYSLVQQLGQELEELVDLHDLSLPRERVVNGESFDPLEFDQYNELHTCSRRLIEAAVDTREIGRNVEEHLAALVDMLVDQSRLNRENQEAVLHTRMVAVQTIVPRLQRSVRQASRLAAKAVSLTCKGTDTMMDSDVLSGLLDPLMHMLRNAVDHGIEAEDARMASGKSPGGHIDLVFQREGNHIAIRCEDDGGGLDLDAVRAAAERRGLVSAGENLSDEELIHLVLRPNFSTRSQATQLSGRGIGLDAVNSRVVSLGGSLRLETERGKGCRITLRLPLTLISTHALLVRATNQAVAVSTRGVEQILHPESGEVVRFGDQITFRVVDAVYPCTPLAELLGLPHDRRAEDRGPRPALLVQTDTGLQAVLMDAVIDSRDLVVKSMGRYLPKIRGIAGATILGDGSVTPVLDLPELLRDPAREEHVESEQETPDAGIDVSMPFALVVDDSLSARRSLAQFMGDSGFLVRTARDGLEAVKIMQSRTPDILLVDLEMPRMNGLELTHHVRASDTMREVPIIMITSRSTDKHRSQAEEAGVTRYLTKPFAETELIEQVYAVCGMR